MAVHSNCFLAACPSRSWTRCLQKLSWISFSRIWPNAWCQMGGAKEINFLSWTGINLLLCAASLFFSHFNQILWDGDSYTLLVIHLVSSSFLIYNRDSESQLRDWLSLLLTLLSSLQASLAWGQLLRICLAWQRPSSKIPPAGEPLQETLYLANAERVTAGSTQMDFYNQSRPANSIKAYFGSWANILKESCDPDRWKASRFQTELGTGASFLNFVCRPITFPTILSQPNREFQAEGPSEWKGKERKERRGVKGKRSGPWWRTAVGRDRAQGF